MRQYAWFAVLLFAAAAQAQISIDAGTSVLIDAREPGPIQKAARDLASDMQAVFGKTVRLTHDRTAASSATICIAFSQNLPKSVRRPTGWETLAIQAVSDPWPGSPVRQAVVLTGSDVRGAIYAIYEFSHRFLKVDPFYWWTDNRPARRQRVVIPAGFVAREGSPTFRYRGWFMNDEDLMTAWRPGIQDKTGISLKTWDRVFEALLRLKGNMIIPNTFVFPYEPQVRAAADRGLAITQHHMEPLGLNVYQWPDDKPYTLDLLTAAWKCAVAQYPRDLEIVWTVGLRGRYDRPFWRDTPNGPTTLRGQGAADSRGGRPADRHRPQRLARSASEIHHELLDGGQRAHARRAAEAASRSHPGLGRRWLRPASGRWPDRPGPGPLLSHRRARRQRQQLHRARSHGTHPS